MFGKVVSALSACALLGSLGCAAVEPGSYRTGSRDLVLQLVEIPGVLKPGEPTSLLPTFSLYGDGRAIVAVRGQYDGALPVVRELHLSRERTDQLVQAGLDAGVQDEAEHDIDIKPDAPTSIMTLTAEEKSGWVQLGPDVGGGLGDLRDALMAYSKRTADTTPYRHDAISTVANASTGGPPSKTWPFRNVRPSAERRIEGALCSSYRRSEVDDLTATARGATPKTSWLSGNESFLVQFRPMLPHEVDCKSLIRKPKHSPSSSE